MGTRRSQLGAWNEANVGGWKLQPRHIQNVAPGPSWYQGDVSTRQFRKLEEGENMVGLGHSWANGRDWEVRGALFLQVPDPIGAGEVRQQCDRVQEFFCIRSSNGYS
jgi:hypothetical protein